ncbi:MAG: MAPEG family protein, partial [Gemmatimonadaceae bacterium]
MSVASLLLPVFVQVALTFALMLWMASRRVAEVKSGTVRPREIALRQPNWSERTTQIANCFHNQLELPMLVYVLVALILITNTNSTIFVLLAWLFVRWSGWGRRLLYYTSVAGIAATVAFVANNLSVLY